MILKMVLRNCGNSLRHSKHRLEREQVCGIKGGKLTVCSLLFDGLIMILCQRFILSLVLKVPSGLGGPSVPTVRFSQHAEQDG